jgi:hypothetical protein
MLQIDLAMASGRHAQHICAELRQCSRCFATTLHQLTRCCLHLLRYQQDKQKAAQAAVEMKRSLHQQLHAVEVRKQAEAALEQQVGSGACFQGSNAWCTVPVL